VRKPEEPGVAVEYRDHWFFIPDSDHASVELTGRGIGCVQQIASTIHEVS
jgi:hypothetical protein